MSQNLQERITSALTRVLNPRTGSSVLAAEMVRDVALTTDGKVRLTLLLSPQDDATLVRQVRQAVEAVSGVTDVRVDVKDATERAKQGAVPPPGSAGPGQGRALPVMEAPRPPQPRAAAPTPVPYPRLGRIIAVSSGKGGVGKSTVCVNIAVSLAARGARVGILDADIYGPNIPRMMGVMEAPRVVNDRIIPLDAHGVKVMSIGFIIERDQPAIWRGPIVMKILTQFLGDVDWGDLDYLLVDMPPGTGDAQLSLVQATQVHGAIIVTTPQEVAVGDALRGAKMFQRVGVPVLGIVENMSWFECPHCGKPTALFGSGGGDRLAKELDLPLLGQIPLAPRVMEGGDTGAPVVLADARSAAAQALVKVADAVAEAMAHHGATAAAR
ncbi:MAG TPA: Mrp/NBP35 family ATP-binding protein [Gemmatimonadaceae bacterium]|jgi:ATP-binding protein involved in chromosome partitioning|nr:Mrp/NBP35 family ATP-binding protein [Gemmatimonadaceae bacterium]